MKYQKELDKLLSSISEKNKVPNILLHACCAPCSSYCIEYLSKYFNVTLFFYNPNISSDSEYEKRARELKRLIGETEYPNKVSYIEAAYEPKEFYDTVKGYEDCAEGHERCFLCYELRLDKTARAAVSGNYDYFCTTLSISPLKNAEKINEIGYKLQEKYNISWLPSDFKKKEGFKRSIELSNEHNLYRQNYCGCVYSVRK